MQILRRITHWRMPLVFAVVGAVAVAFGDAGREVLRYDRAAIADGEYWRLLSGHIAHLGFRHLLLNLAGLALVWLLVGRRYSTRHWILVAAISVLLMDAGFWFVDAGMRWYVGLSGMLHGLLLAGAIRGLRSLPGESIVICTLLVAKLAYEQVAGPLPGAEAAAGGAVVVNSHLYGAIGGALSTLVFWRRVRTPASI
jgi:rhomboid family GlyGly-CTERM serine protease